MAYQRVTLQRTSAHEHVPHVCDPYERLQAVELILPSAVVVDAC